jgi:hypothetical protein
MNPMGKMRPRLIGLLSIALLGCVLFGEWHFRPWREKLILADGKSSDGTRYCVVQVYKDFAEGGWVMGLYQMGDDNRWYLRLQERSDSRWERADLLEEAGEIKLVAKNFSETKTFYGNDFKTDGYDMRGWVFPERTKISEIQKGFIHSTY